MSDNTYEKPEDECELTTHIASALNSYIGEQFASSCTMGIKRQGMSGLEHSEVLPDLVKRLDERRILALEVKVRSTTKEDAVGHKLKSFDVNQRKIYSALHSCNVPIYYCYNADDEPHELLGPEGTLRSSNACEPAVVCDDEGFVTKYHEHDNLLNLIAMLKNGEVGETGGAAGAIFPFIAGDNTSRVGIRRLLLAYNIEDDSFEIFDDEYIRDCVSRAIQRRIQIFENINDKNAAQIARIFRSYTRNFNAMIARARENSQKADNSFTL